MMCLLARKSVNKETPNCRFWQLGASNFYDLFSPETACPIVNFVKNSVKWVQVVLIWLQVCHFCEKSQSAEKPVVSRVLGFLNM